MIGKAVKKLIEESPPIVSAFGDKLYPVIAPQKVQGPFLVYGVTGVGNTDTKENSIMDAVSVEVHIFSDDYVLIHTAAQQIRIALEKFKGTVEGIYLSDVVFDDYSDAYDGKYERFKGQLVFIFYTDANYQS